MASHLNLSYLITVCLAVLAYLSVGLAQDGEGTYEGVVYSYFTTENWDFDAAQLHCESYTSNTGGLAELTNEGIKNFINNLITGNYNMWIGSRKISGTFTWIGSSTDTPDSSVIGAGNGKDCVYYRNSGQWKADRCTRNYGAICSRPGNTSEPSNDVTADSGKSRLLKFLRDRHRPSGRKERGISNSYSTPPPPIFDAKPTISMIKSTQMALSQDVPVRTVQERAPRRKRELGSNPDTSEEFSTLVPLEQPCVFRGDTCTCSNTTKNTQTSVETTTHRVTTESAGTITPTNVALSQDVPVRTVQERARRRKRNGSDEKDCEESSREDSQPMPPKQTCHICRGDTEISVGTPSNGSTLSSDGTVNLQASTQATANTVPSLSPVTIEPEVTEPPTVEGNVSQVVGLTKDTKYFSSPAFVTELEKWLADNDEIPDDLTEAERLEYVKDFFDVCNNVFEVDLLALGETDAASIFADACSHLAQDLTSDLEIGESLNISTSNVDMYASVQQVRNFTGYKQVIEEDDDNDSDETVQVVVIPPDVVSDLHLTEADTIAVSVVVYKRGHFIVDHYNTTIDTSHRPAGSVVSITVAVNDTVTSVPVVFQLENDVAHLVPEGQSNYDMYEPGNASCVFWESKGEGEGEWNDYGCEVLNATREFTLCACNHTTHFGVLLQVHEVEIPPADELALTLITYIGAGISIGCLIITLLILNMLTSLTSDRVRIHKNLATALTIAQGIFLCTDVASKNDISCKVVTLLLHYFYLCVFCWSLLEGINLYVQIVQVFTTGKTMKYIHYLLLGWGLPVPIVAISAGARWKIYGADKQCWLTTDEGMIWAFAGPVIFVITINLIILCMVVRVIVKSASAHKKENYDHIKAGVKGALLLVPILGLGWVFGFLSLGESTLVFTYLFVITVALQGVLIFLLYCAFNSEVRAALKRKDEKRKLRRGDGLSSVPTPSSLHSSQSNDTSTTFATKLIDRIKRRKSSATPRTKNSPVDTIRLVDRSESAQSTRDITLHPRENGSIDSGYSQNLENTPTCIPNDSMASIRTETLPTAEFIPPNTPTFEK